MSPTPSAHVDTFCRDHLPPREQEAELLLDEPWLRYPAQLNCATALLDATVDEHGGDRPCLRSPGGPACSGRAAAPGRRARRRARR